MANNIPEDHEAEYIKAFVKKDRRDRYLTLSGSKKGRRKFLTLLAHDHVYDLKPGCFYQIPATDLTKDKILQILGELSARKDCYTISEYSKIDNQTMLLSDALSEIFGRGMGTILSIVPGKLAYYESENRNGRYVISAPKG